MSKRLLLVFVIYAAAFILLSACSTGPVQSCRENWDQPKCFPRERGGRHFLYTPPALPMKYRMLICSSRATDPFMTKWAKCRKSLMMAGL